jgi:uncharacterized protein
VLIYLDACIVIYLIELPPGFGVRALNRFAALTAANDVAIISELTRLECRSLPLGAGDTVTLGQFDHFFASSVGPVLQLTRAVCERATEIRGLYNFRTADSLHLAAAVESGCGTFLTNDTRLSRFTGLTVEILP